MVEEVKLDDNVEIIMNSNVVSISGAEVINKITIKDKHDNTRDIDISGLFIAVGQQPKNELFADVVELDEKGYIKAINDVYTTCKSIYVAGDTRAKELRQLTTAVADGSLAATIAIREMKENG